jgi:hypothetical protein
MLNPRRNGALAALVVTALALMVPSSALAGHDLVIYKAEAHLDLNADEAATSVSCQPGDHAVDGMWRIDHADQDDYVAPLDLIAGAVDVLEAAPSGPDDSTYSFIFEKNAIGRAQVKVWVTCIADKTVGGSHTHDLSGGFVKSDGSTAATAPAGYETTSATATGTGDPNTPVTSTIQTGAGSCPNGTMLVSPGFKTDPSLGGPTPDVQDDANIATPAPGNQADPSPGMDRIFTSISSNSRDWTWRFENSSLPLNYRAVIHTFWRCLKIKIPAGGNDKHKYIPKFKKSTQSPASSSVSELRLNCGDHYKGIVGGFDTDPHDSFSAAKASFASDDTGLFSPPPTTKAFNNVFYLGMDPRIKQRAFRFVNRGSSGSYDVDLALLCINYRTT